MIYLDHAATSYPKPDSVLAAVRHWYENIGISADRGDGPRSREAAQTVQRARSGVARMCGTADDRVAFVSGATEGLNLALRALLQPGARVATTAFEHSSIARVLTALEQPLQVTVDRATTIAELCTWIEERKPAVVAFTHASNVTGEVFDAASICAAAKQAGAVSVLDVSQTAGYLPLDVGADVVIGSAHKAMHGPPGLGFVAVRQGLELRPQKQGGTGSSVALDHHPTEWPTAFEAGTPNTPAIFGLAAALDWLDEQGMDALLQRSLAVLEVLREGLQAIDGVHVLPAEGTVRTPVLSFTHERYDVLELGSMLAGAGMHVRAGFHCAPWVHEQLGTGASGTVRISTGPHNTRADVDAVLQLLRAI